MRVAWLAPYPVQLLEPSVRLARKPDGFHPCSWIVNLSRALAQQPDIELHLLTESTLVPCDQVVESGGIVFHVLKASLPLVNRGFPTWLPLDVLSGFRYNVKRQVKEIEKIKPDVVHAHGTERAYAMAGVASGRPCLVSMQGIVTEIFRVHPNFGSWLIQRMEQRTVQRAQFFGCRTGFDTSFVRRFNPGARIFTLYEAMNPVFYRNQWGLPPPLRILYVGSLATWKGVETLLESVGLVKTRYPEISLDVIGSGNPKYVGQLKQMCGRLGLGKRVSFLGQRTADEIADAHLQAQIFVLPSDNENSPNTLAEAMVSGMPVIATNVGGIPSMVTDGETGLLVPPRNPAKLAEAILRLWEHPAERARLGKNARQVACELHWPKSVAAQTVAAYDEILRLEAGGRG